MTRFTCAVLAATGVSFAVPAFADDPPAPGSAEQLIADQEAEAKAYWSTASTIQVEEVRDGAGSMEPQDQDVVTGEERVDSEFGAAILKSP
jgi:hypothetical protein